MARSKADSNQPAIRDGLRALGATVQCLHTVRRGCPDLLVGWRGRNWLLELKGPGGKLTPDEVHWHGTWGGQVATVSTLEQALEVIGVQVGA